MIPTDGPARQTLDLIEQSCRTALQAAATQPNRAVTWNAVQAAVVDILTGFWRQGSLAGASPTEAFQVNVGLGTTMTPDDILEGILRVAVVVTVAGSSEPIEITLQQQMSGS